MCARLSVRCSEWAQRAVSPYGDEVEFELPSNKKPCKVSFKNTPDIQRFEIINKAPPRVSSTPPLVSDEHMAECLEATGRRFAVRLEWLGRETLREKMLNAVAPRTFVEISLEITAEAIKPLEARTSTLEAGLAMCCNAMENIAKAFAEAVLHAQPRELSAITEPLALERAVVRFLAAVREEAERRHAEVGPVLAKLSTFQKTKPRARPSNTKSSGSVRA
jgi:hypothetical protein